MLAAALAAVVLSALHPPDVELIGGMNGESLEVVAAQLGRVMVEKKDVTLRISSPGGNGIATLLFIDQVQDMKARQRARVTCVASVMAASAAAILLESPVCDRRLMTDGTILLFHGVTSGAEGKTGDIEDTLKLLKDLDRMVANMIAPRMGMTPAEYLEWIDRHDRWLTSDEALARRAVDEVVPSGLPASPPPALSAPPVSAVPLPPQAPPNCPPPAVSPREVLKAIASVVKGRRLEIAWGLQAALSILALWYAWRRPSRQAPAARRRSR